MESNSPQVRRLSRTELYERVWSTPMQRLAKEFGVSDVGLSKFCRKHGIPTPPRGYWMMPPARKAALREPLREGQAPDQLLTIHASPTDPLSAPSIPIDVTVPTELVNPKPLVAATARGLRSGKRGEDGLITPGTKGALPIRVGRDSVDRMARILQALLDCLEQRGHQFAVKTSDRGNYMASQFSGSEVRIALGEEVDRRDRELTAHEKRQQERSPWMYQQPLYTYSPSGRLYLKLDHYYSGLRKNWADGKRQRVEECLGDFVGQLERVAAQMKADREEREADERRRRAWELERAEKLRTIKAEEDRLVRLNAQADAWHRSQRLREFAAAVRAAAAEGRLQSDADLERWLHWVADQADRLDPLVESPPSVVEEKQKYERHYYAPPAAGDP